MMKQCVKTRRLRIVFFLGVSCVPLAVQPVQALWLNYGGEYHGSSPASSPSIAFSIKEGAVVYGTGSFNVGFSTGISFPEDLQTLMVSINSVSYKASWLSKPVEVYQRKIPNIPPAFDDNAKQSLFFAIDLTGVPTGPQQIEVTVNGGAIVTAFSTYLSYNKTTVAKLSFTISPPPLPETSNSTDWNTKTIDTLSYGASIGSYPIAVDSKGTPHIAYTRYISGVTFVTMLNGASPAGAFKH
jgi:hypothetical protein